MEIIQKSKQNRTYAQQSKKKTINILPSAVFPV